MRQYGTIVMHYNIVRIFISSFVKVIQVVSWLLHFRIPDRIQCPYIYIYIYICLCICACVCLVVYINCVKCGHYLKSKYFHCSWRRHVIPLVDIHFRSCGIKKKANYPDTLRHAFFQRIFFFKRNLSRNFPKLLTLRIHLMRKCLGSLNYYIITLNYFTMRIGVTAKLQYICSSARHEGIQESGNVARICLNFGYRWM